MTASCWLALGSLTLSLPSNSLKVFDGHIFIPKYYLASYPITLSGKTTTVDIEVIDRKLDYNLLLGRTWTYVMTTILSIVFCIILFPLDGKIVTVDQLSFCAPNYSPLLNGFVPLVGGVPESYVSIGTGLLQGSSPMGCFPLLSPMVPYMVFMVSSIPHESTDPWILPTPSDIDTYGEQIHLSLAELAYQSIQSTFESSVTLVTANGTTSPRLTTPSFNLLNQVLPSDEAIREIMCLEEKPWEESHHRVSIYDSDMMPLQILSFDAPEIMSSPYMTIQTLDSEEDMGNISKTLLINISVKIGIVENIQVGVDCTLEEIASFTCLFKEFRNVFVWSYKEMSGIDLSIVDHEIKIYENSKHFYQRLQPFHLRKTTTIKTEVEKLLRVGFVYPVPLIEWVSNIVLVVKKQGTIRVCVYYRDLNIVCPKDNYPTPFIDQIIDDCASCESFSFLNIFSGYNQIAIKPVDQQKTTFIFPWGICAYQKLPFGLKNAGETFQRAMDYTFHDIRHIVQGYLDDLPAHSKKQAQHLDHLRAIFLRWRFYNICLNPHKFIFFVESRCLHGFIVSKYGIRVDPDKVKAITHFPHHNSFCISNICKGKKTSYDGSS